jgi:acyl carrier protein
MNEVRDRLVKCFAAVFPELNEREIPLASTASVGAWDSLASITLLSVLEEEFQVQLDPEELEHLVSFDLIFDHLLHDQQVS